MPSSKKILAEHSNGSVRERKPGQWEARFIIVLPNGVKERKSLYGKTEEEVIAKARDYKKKIDTGKINTTNVTLSDALEEWLYVYKRIDLKPQTFDRYESTYLCHIKNGIGKLPLSKIQPKDIQILINKKSETHSYSSVKKIQELLNSFYKHGVITGDLFVNPVSSIKLPKRGKMAVKTQAVDIYPKEEIDTLINAISCLYEDKGKFRYSPAWIFILNTGIRAGELLALTWDAINYEQGFMKIYQSMAYAKNREERVDGKTGKKELIDDTTKTYTSMRLVPLNAMAISALDELKRRNDKEHIKSNYVVCTYKGGPQMLRTIEEALYRICDAAGITYRGIHALRHTFATIALSKGVDVKVVSDILGHKDVSITYNKYIHILQEQKIQSVISVLDVLTAPSTSQTVQEENTND